MADAAMDPAPVLAAIARALLPAPGVEALLALAARLAVHSALATVVVEGAVSGLRVADPLCRQRLRSLSLGLPVLTAGLSPLAVAWGWPALLRLSPLSSLRLGWLPLPLLLAALLLVSASLFVVQEGLPWWRERAGVGTPPALVPPPGSRLARALTEVFGASAPPCYQLAAATRSIAVHRVHGREALVFGGDFPGWLDDEELRAVLAHERAHIDRGELRWRALLYGLRVAQLFAPTALLEYRLLVNDSEQACDDAAVERLGRPLALASGLLKAHRGAAAPAGSGRLRSAALRVEEHAHRSRVEQRVRRLLAAGPDRLPGEPLGGAGLAALLATALTSLLLAVA